MGQRVRLYNKILETVTNLPENKLRENVDHIALSSYTTTKPIEALGRWASSRLLINNVDSMWLKGVSDLSGVVKGYAK